MPDPISDALDAAGITYQPGFTPTHAGCPAEVIFAQMLSDAHPAGELVDEDEKVLSAWRAAQIATRILGAALDTRGAPHPPATTQRSRLGWLRNPWVAAIDARVERRAWATAGFSRKEAKRWRDTAIVFEIGEARAWTDTLGPLLPDHLDVSAEAPVWRTNGFAAADAAQWATVLGRWCRPPSPGSPRSWSGDLVKRAAGWRDAGFDPGEAVEWITGVTEARADACYGDWIGPGGLDAEMASATRYLPSDAEGWRRIGVTPSEAASYYRRGYQGPGEVLPPPYKARELAAGELQALAVDGKRLPDEAVEGVKGEGLGQGNDDVIDDLDGGDYGVGEDDFDFWRDVIGDDLVWCGVVYDRREWRMSAYGDDVERIPKWEQDRDRYYELLEARGGDVEAELAAELNDPVRNWAAALDELRAHAPVRDTRSGDLIEEPF